MRLYFLNKKIKILLIVTTALLLLALYPTFAMWKCSRIPDNLYSSKETWVSNSGNIVAYIYNTDNMPENYLPIYSDMRQSISTLLYDGEYPSNEIANSGKWFLLVLKHDDVTKYFMLNFNASGNFFSHDGVLIKYDVTENSVDMNNTTDINSRMLFGSSIKLKIDSNGKSNDLNCKSFVFKKVI